jgi:hypothetical protein
MYFYAVYRRKNIYVVYMWWKRKKSENQIHYLHEWSIGQMKERDRKRRSEKQPDWILCIILSGINVKIDELFPRFCRPHFLAPCLFIVRKRYKFINLYEIYLSNSYGEARDTFGKSNPIETYMCAVHI